MTPWKRINNRGKYGVAIYSYNDKAPLKLKLNIGDSIHLLEECEGWFYGYCFKDRLIKGIIPKSFIHVKDAVIEQTGHHEIILQQEPPIVQEITSTLREWATIWKQLYISGRVKDFENVRMMMYDLMDHRRQILSGTLPVDELKELKQQLTTQIDYGNKLLGLDLVVRDEQGNILNPDITSTIELYRQHELATQRLQKADAFRHSKSVTAYSHSLYVSLKNFVCKIGDDADLLMTIYDAKEGKFISENYIVKWAKEGLTRDLDQLNNLRVLFTDLGSKDLERQKVFLVCQIIRIGAMDLRDGDHKRTSHIPKKITDKLRRPFGVAAMDITDFINGKIESDEENFIPFIQCGERESLDTMIRKVIVSKDVSQKEHKGQGLFVSFKLIHGDLKQARQAFPHLISLGTSVARKMGFPEIILPGDVRNDLYLTLAQGEFTKGSKSSDKNVEVTVRVYNDKGEIVPGYISIGAGTELMQEFRSVIYYHEDKPKWFETFKIAIPIEEFSSAHLRFLFKHRSSNEAKDRAEKPFAMSFAKLHQPNGTTLKDECHDLFVYKIDHKKFDENDVQYLQLPSTRREWLAEHRTSDQIKPAIASGGLSSSYKDSFQISTLVCSTKLTQNVDLLGLLKWSDNQENLKSNLSSLMNVDGEEVVKFLQDVLDALFNILMLNTDSDQYDNLVFDALVSVIELISNIKYQHFRPVLDLYIKETFSATLAHTKLMQVLKCLVDNSNDTHARTLSVMKSLEYIFKFIVRSQVLYSQLNEGKGRRQFEDMLEQLLKSFSGMMLFNSDSMILIQGACLKYLPTTIVDILHVFDATKLSFFFTDLINNVPMDRVTKQKMMCVNDIIYSDLFKIPECRHILLPVFNEHLRVLLSKEIELELCVKIISDMLEVLHQNDVGPIYDDIADILVTIFRTVVQTVINMDRDFPLVGNLVAIMIAILRQMSRQHFKMYLSRFNTQCDLLDFLMEILMVLQDLVNKNVYPLDWNEMIILQNNVLLKALNYFSHTIRDQFTSNFVYQVWNNFFHCAISFLTQESLQLENFSQNKRNKIISRYQDMRQETGYLIRSMWFSLGQHKIKFVPGMVGPFLEMTLIPEVELRKATIPIFFDMMQCEFYSQSSNTNSGSYMNLDEVVHSHRKEIKGNFLQFENEMITKLDMLIKGGRGNEQYIQLYHNSLTETCENHSTMREQGLRFVNIVTRLMKRLLEYRAVTTDENKENQMMCTVNLLEFYNEINRNEMYIRYLYKLCDLHLECDNYTEAAFTLKLHAESLEWSDEQLPVILKNIKYPYCETHRELKVALYDEMIKYFDKGKMWEMGLNVCKELAEQYENETFDYMQLSVLLQRMASFYDIIMKQMRPEPEYFRVAYYGLGFPGFLQNKIFIYRGKGYERLSDFSSRLQNQFPNAELMTKLDPPSEDILTSNLQYLQINKVDPIMEERPKFSNKSVHPQILKFYKVNEVQHFVYSRPLKKGERDSDNEFANLWLERTCLQTSYPLPGILRWFPAKVKRVFEVSPLENAIETMDATNRKLFGLINAHQSDSNLPLNPLSMMLNGVVDAAVMGGIINYEKAFFTPEYLQKYPNHADGVQRLKDLIAQQIPLLEMGLSIHRVIAPENLKPFQDRMEECFIKMRVHVEEKYGKKKPDFLDGRRFTMTRRPKTMPPKSYLSGERLSDISLSVSDMPQFHSYVQQPASLRLSTSPSKLSPTARAQSVFIRPNSPLSTGRNQKQKRDSTLRRNSATSVGSRELETTSQTMWYDTKPEQNHQQQQTVIELKEQLTPHRPLRSEADLRRSNRPPSGQFNSLRHTPSPTRHTVAAVSPVSIVTSPPADDDTPPPLPQKQSLADYNNLPVDGNCVTFPRKGSLPLAFNVRNKPPPPLPGKDRTPPTPPKKQNRATLCPQEK